MNPREEMGNLWDLLLSHLIRRQAASAKTGAGLRHLIGAGPASAVMAHREAGSLVAGLGGSAAPARAFLGALFSAYLSVGKFPSRKRTLC